MLDNKETLFFFINKNKIEAPSRFIKKMQKLEIFMSVQLMKMDFYM
jgi:hypothetical protein